MNRILFISHERKMGGANFALYELVKELQDAGNQVSVVVLYKGCPIDKELKKGGIKTFPCFFGWWQQPENWSFFLKWAFRLLHWLQWISVIRISKFVRKEKIQIIHSNSSVIDIGAQVAENMCGISENLEQNIITLNICAAEIKQLNIFKIIVIKLFLYLMRYVMRIPI